MPQGKTINSLALKELFEESTDGLFPFLADVQHDYIRWGENDNEQENGHIRLINDASPVRYKDKKYMPAYFAFTIPTEDGKKISNTTITISSIDKRIIEVIRSINSFPPTLTITAAFAKKEIEGKIGYTFYELGEYKFSMNNCRWDGTTAQWDLVFDSAMQLNVPVDIGTEFRNPSVNTK